jgi:O-antigen/teichoic acid export membrane protein
VAVATAFVAVLGLLLLVLVGRHVGPARYGTFVVVWSLVLAVFSTLLGIQQEVVRTVSAGRAAGQDAAHESPVVRVALAAGSVALLALVATSPWWARRLFADHAGSVVGAVVVGVLGYVVTLAINGVLVGRKHWNDYALIVVADAVVRAVAVVAATYAGAGVVGWAWALAVSGFAWIPLLVRGRVRGALLHRTAGPLPRGVGHALTLVAGTACSTVLVVGFPVLLRATTSTVDLERLGVVVALVTLTRAPVLLPIIAFQGPMIEHFVRHSSDIVRRTLALAGGVVVLGLAGAGLALLVGPATLRLVMGERFASEPVVVAGLTLGAASLGLVTVTSTALVALARRGASSAGWLVATAATLVLLVVPADLDTRTTTALLLGPLAGVLVHLVVLARARRGVATRLEPPGSPQPTF